MRRTAQRAGAAFGAVALFCILCAAAGAQQLTGTVTVNGNSSPGNYGYIITDGVTTLTGQNGANAALARLGSFNGNNGTITGTINILNFHQPDQGTFIGRQYFRVGLINAASRNAAVSNTSRMYPATSNSSQTVGLEFAQTISPDKGVFAILDGTPIPGDTRFIRLFDFADPDTAENRANPNAAYKFNFRLTIGYNPNGPGRQLTLLIPNQYNAASFRTTTTVNMAEANLLIQGISGNSSNANATLSVSNLRFAPAPVLRSVTLSPVSIFGGAAVTGTVTLGAPAPTGGIVITLKSSASSVVVPASVTVPAGASSAKFTAATKPVGAVSSVSVSGSDGFAIRPASLTLYPPIVKTLTLQPSSVYGGLSGSGVVTLGSAAPVGGTSIRLSSSSANAVVPASVTVAAGATSAAFSIATKPVFGVERVNILAGPAPNDPSKTSKTVLLQIAPTSLRAIALTPTSVQGGLQNSAGTVALYSPAPAGGIKVSLSSNTNVGLVNSTVTVPAGATRANFTVYSRPVKANVITTIKATLNGISRYANLTVTPAAGS